MRVLSSPLVFGDVSRRLVIEWGFHHQEEGRDDNEEHQTSCFVARYPRPREEEEEEEEENNDDPDEYTFVDDMKSSEEEDINEVLKGVAEKEIMLKKLTDTMVKQFLKTGDRGDEDDEDQEREEKRGKETNEDENDGDFEGVVGEEGEMMRAKTLRWETVPTSRRLRLRRGRRLFSTPSTRRSETSY